MGDNTVEIYHKIYLKYAGILFSFAEKYVSSFISEDIVHDVFLEIWDKHIYHLPEEEVKLILYTAVKNACIDYLRRSILEKKFVDTNVNKLKLEELETKESPENIFMQKDLFIRIQKEVNELPEQRKLIFKMFYLEDMKTSEISDKLKISKRTVENHIYRALKYLRKKCINTFSLFI